MLDPLAVQHFKNRLNVFCTVMRDVIFELYLSDVYSKLFFPVNQCREKTFSKCRLKTKACQEDEAESSNSTVDWDEN